MAQLLSSFLSLCMSLPLFILSRLSLVSLFLIGGTQLSWAEPTLSKSSAPHLRFEMMTDAPIQIGIGVLSEWSKGLRVSSSLGWMPQKYIAGTNTLVTTFVPSYTPETAQLVEDTIQNSLVWRTHLGWRPSLDSGFYTRLGYTLFALGGGSTPQGLVEGITGESINDPTIMTSQNTSSYIDASASLHLISVGVGWEWEVYQKKTHRLFFRTALECFRAV